MFVHRAGQCAVLAGERESLQAGGVPPPHQGASAAAQMASQKLGFLRDALIDETAWTTRAVLGRDVRARRFLVGALAEGKAAEALVASIASLLDLEASERAARQAAVCTTSKYHALGYSPEGVSTHAALAGGGALQGGACGGGLGDGDAFEEGAEDGNEEGDVASDILLSVATLIDTTARCCGGSSACVDLLCVCAALVGKPSASACGEVPQRVSVADAGYAEAEAVAVAARIEIETKTPAPAPASTNGGSGSSSDSSWGGATKARAPHSAPAPQPARSQAQPAMTSARGRGGGKGRGGRKQKQKQKKGTPREQAPTHQRRALPAKAPRASGLYSDFAGGDVVQSIATLLAEGGGSVPHDVVVAASARAIIALHAHVELALRLPGMYADVAVAAPRARAAFILRTIRTPTDLARSPWARLRAEALYNP
jgi:hypothetical protein